MTTAARYRTNKAYDRYLTNELEQMIDALNLSELRKRALKARWLDSVNWMGNRAQLAQKWYYALRLTAIVGAILIPTSVTVSRVSTLEGFAWVSMGLGVLVAIASAVEEFFHFGERWRHYRSTVETLKIEGWQFFQLTGPYSRRKTHADAYEKFAGRVEETLNRDVAVYIREIAGDQDEERAESNIPGKDETEE
ncbi:MAG: DUF4231 domain-containing protein [Chloroflexi bacterium]|jgi:hypothetical protein|nr:DUF4231 domain-containing protein [Chloroflexota bacterium]